MKEVMQLIAKNRPIGNKFKIAQYGQWDGYPGGLVYGGAKGEAPIHARVE